MDFNLELNNKIEMLNKEMDKYLAISYPENIYEAARYSVFAGGKRLRPVLMMAACEAVGGNIKDVLPFACALEMIHTYSLIHDDLPAMDNDDFRRGNPTCHKKFDEATAILAGDFLLNYAFEIIMDTVCDNTDKKYALAGKVLSHLCGSKGMLVGQVVDVLSEGKKIDGDTLLYIHDNKTGGLVKAALMVGAIIGGASDEAVKKFEKIGYNIGIAFQIKDDILDVTSTTEELGKPVLSDIKNQKVTYVSMFGLEKSEEDYNRLSEEAVDEISAFGENAQFLKEYAKNLINRRK